MAIGRIFGRFDTIHEREGQTAHDSIGHAYACIVRQKYESRIEVFFGRVDTRCNCFDTSTALKLR